MSSTNEQRDIELDAEERHVKDLETYALENTLSFAATDTSPISAISAGKYITVFPFACRRASRGDKRRQEAMYHRWIPGGPYETGDNVVLVYRLHMLRIKILFYFLSNQ